MEINKEMYGAYVKQITPTHNKWINLLWAFCHRRDDLRRRPAAF